MFSLGFCFVLAGFVVVGFLFVCLVGWLVFVCLFVCLVVLGIKPRTLHVLSQCPATELHP